MLLAKQDEAGVILTDEQNDFLFADASRMEEIMELNANICLLARIQLGNIDSDAGSSYDSAFLSAVKKNVDTVLKIRNSLQGMFMLGPKPMSFYDSKLKHGLGYANSYTRKKVISQNPKLYDSSCLDDSEIHMSVRDTDDILEDATKSQIKMKKQNVSTIEYKKLNALYEDFVPQKELSAEQKYFPPSFMSLEDPTNASLTYSSSETQPTKKQMPSAKPILVDLN
ncbi:hypothetical protein Tco_1577350 [Tanacetum coccineum]